MSDKKSINPMNSVHYYAIVRQATLRVVRWLREAGCYSYKKGISNEKSAKAVMELILRQPDPLLDYLYGLSRLRRIQINGKGTKKGPYIAVWCEDYFKDT